MQSPNRESVKAVLYQGLLGWDGSRVAAGDLGYVQDKYEELTDKVIAFFALHYHQQAGSPVLPGLPGGHSLSLKPGQSF